MMKGSSQAIIYSSFGNSVGQAIASTAEGGVIIYLSGDKVLHLRDTSDSFRTHAHMMRRGQVVHAIRP